VKKLLFSGFAMMALAGAPGAYGAEVSDGRAYDWSGFYLGAHLGNASGRSGWSATQPGGAPSLNGAVEFFQPYDVFTGRGSQFAGFQAGYNYMFGSRFVVGFEADGSFPGLISASQSFTGSSVGATKYEDTVDALGTARARIGYDVNHWLYYATGGFAWTYDQFTRTQINDSPSGTPAGTVATAFGWRLGWTVGAGVEAPVAPGWTAKFEYLYAGFGPTGVGFPAGAQRFESDLALHEFRVGLNYKLNPSGIQPDGSGFGPPSFDMDNWSLHGQATLVAQYAPPFHQPYRGANSLDSNAGRQTWDGTLYIGRRLWEGAELWINPELDQGFGISNSLGVAGFPSAEAYKIGSSYPYLRLPRTFIRQTFDLGGETEKVESDVNQFAGSRSADRLVVTVGKFSVSDIFDTVKYAHDPRNDFLNWTLIDGGTFDYAADAWGFTYGAAAEWYQGAWTLRAGLFDLSLVPNDVELDHRFDQFQIVSELEHRHEIMGQPGKLAVNGFISRGRMGSFNDAVALAQQTGTMPDTADVRRYTSRTGVTLLAEQQIMANIGIFSRVGWADGSVESFDFTDVDRTASAGVSFAGKLWGRPDDTFAVATIVNGISSARAAYLNAGGLDSLIGDGQLPHYGPEQILETYYRFPLGSWQVTADYQFIVNPAYNRDRGPVSVIGGRLRTQF
jgi:high affinity Mn2+ porin